MPHLKIWLLEALLIVFLKIEQRIRRLDKLWLSQVIIKQTLIKNNEIVKYSTWGKKYGPISTKKKLEENTKMFIVVIINQVIRLQMVPNFLIFFFIKILTITLYFIIRNTYLKKF